MSQGQEIESEDDWLFDYMMETFRSPTWEVPVMTFIDENCVIFDNDEENKLIYTEKHREFCQLIDNLLCSHLAEIGVAELQFAKAVEAGYQRRDVNRKVFDQIIAVDDFLTFKKMMVKRNVQLELEVVEAMKNARQRIVPPSSKEEEDQNMKAATKFSEDVSRFEGGKTKDSGNNNGGGSKTGDDKEATQLKAAMEANLLEMQLYAKQMELEQAELEKALAISLKLEEERLMRLKQLQKEQSDVEKLAKEVEKAELELAEERTKEKDRAQRMYEAGERKREEEEEMERQQSEEKAKRKAERKARKKEERRAEKKRLKAEAKAKQKEQESMSMSGGLKPLAPLGGSKFNDDDEDNDMSPKKKSFGGAKSLLGPIPDIKAFQQKKALAMDEFRKNQEEIEKRRAEQEEMQRAANISEQEMEARAEYLRQQRARMLEKKKRERERKLREFQEKKSMARNSEKDKFEKAKMQMQAEKAKAEKDDKPKENNKPKELTAAQKKRRQMAMALGMQMKKDMLDDEDQKNNARQVEQFAALDEQLRQAEKMRQDRRRQHNAQRDRIRQDKLIRAMNVQSSSFANRIVHGDGDFAFKEQ